MEAPVFIREHARNIRHFVAELIGQYSGWPSAADSSADEFICAEITAAIKAHEAAAWQPLNKKPDTYEGIMIAAVHKTTKGKDDKPLIMVYQGMCIDGLWRVITPAKESSGYLSYNPVPPGWRIIAWRYQPRYTPPALEA